MKPQKIKILENQNTSCIWYLVLYEQYQIQIYYLFHTKIRCFTYLFTSGSNTVVLESVWKGFALDWELFSLLKWNCSSACIEERSTPISLMHKRPPLKTLLCGRFYEITFHTRDLKTVFSVTDFLSEKRRMNIGSCRQQPYFRRHCTEIVHCSTITNLDGVLIISLLYPHNRNCHWKYVDILLLLFLVEI